MSQLVKYLIVLAVGGILGYAALPTKTITRVETKEVIKEVEKKSAETNTQNKKNKTYVVIETTHPDGTKTKETRIVDNGTITIDSSSESQTKSSSDTESKSEKIVDRTSETLVYGIGSVNTSNLTEGPDYGLGVQKKLLGPISGGIFGMKSGRVGITLGLGL